MTIKCSVCRGTGRVWRRSGCFGLTRPVPCKACDGTGIRVVKEKENK